MSSKLEPTWQGIPIEVKEEIVQYLDYKSRFRLRVCSKSDQSLVENCPISLDQLEIYLLENSTRSKLHIKKGSDTVELNNNIIDHFFGIFKSKKSTVDSVIFCFQPMHPGQSKMRLMKIERLAKCTKVKAQRVYFKTSGVSSDEFLKIFGLFQPQYLKTISFRQIVSREHIEKLVDTDGWKNVEEIFLYGIQDIPMDSVLHLDRMRLALINHSAEDAWKLINAFVTRDNLEPGFGLRITYTCKLTEQQIASGFQMVPEKVPHLNAYDNQHQSSYHFETRTHGIVFVVRMRSSAFGCQDFEAYACTRDLDIDHQFWQYGSASPADHIQVNRRIRNGAPLRRRNPLIYNI